MFLFVTFYGFGVDVSSYVYCSEIFPTHIRAQGVGFSVSSLFLLTTGKSISQMNFTHSSLGLDANKNPQAYTTAAGPAFNSIGWKYYLVFIVVPSVMLPFMALYFPETKGLTLEEIGALFGEEVAIDITNLSEKEAKDLDERITKTLNIGASDSHVSEKSASIKEDISQLEHNNFSSV